MTTDNRNAMFAHFELAHEQSLVAILNGAPAGAIAPAAALRALSKCQSRIIGELREATGAQHRRELRILYDGLSIAHEFIQQIDRPVD
ncbi:hypothetical protein GN316_15630 [Xylophilus sp. Kf1]|nr:hypothetical protein [Xylophilus sp. Kf1]